VPAGLVSNARAVAARALADPVGRTGLPPQPGLPPAPAQVFQPGLPPQPGAPFLAGAALPTRPPAANGGAAPGGPPDQGELPRRVPMSLRGDRAGRPDADHGEGAPGEHGPLTLEQALAEPRDPGPLLPSGRAWPAAPPEGWPAVTDVDWRPTAKDWQPWPDDAADFAAGILDAQQPSVASPLGPDRPAVAPPAVAPPASTLIQTDIDMSPTELRLPDPATAGRPLRDTRLPGYPPAEEDPSGVTMHLPPVPSQGHDDEH
jgi:hypothetical protein